MAQSGDESKKPRIEVVNEGTPEAARDLWREVAFKQARRANGLRDELKKLRATIDDVLAKDDEETE